MNEDDMEKQVPDEPTDLERFNLKLLTSIVEFDQRRASFILMAAEKLRLEGAPLSAVISLVEDMPPNAVPFAYTWEYGDHMQQRTIQLIRDQRTYVPKEVELWADIPSGRIGPYDAEVAIHAVFQSKNQRVKLRIVDLNGAVKFQYDDFDSPCQLYVHTDAKGRPVERLFSVEDLKRSE